MEFVVLSHKTSSSFIPSHIATKCLFVKVSNNEINISVCQLYFRHCSKNLNTSNHFIFATILGGSIINLI